MIRNQYEHTDHELSITPRILEMTENCFLLSTNLEIMEIEVFIVPEILKMLKI